MTVPTSSAGNRESPRRRSSCVSDLLKRNVVAASGCKIATSRQPDQRREMDRTPPTPTAVVALPAKRKENTP